MNERGSPHGASTVVRQFKSILREYGARSLGALIAAQINWERPDFESRVELAADNIESFVEAVLGTIDAEAARSSPDRWEAVCRFFAGSARAALAQGDTPRAGGKRIAAYLAKAFPDCESEGSQNGFFEFMDWLSNPDDFRPAALRQSIR